MFFSIGNKSDGNCVQIENKARMKIVNGPRIGANEMNGSADCSGCGNMVIIDNSETEKATYFFART